MTISVTVRTSKENGATVEKRSHGDLSTIVEVPKESEQMFHVWDGGSVTVRESK